MKGIKTYWSLGLLIAVLAFACRPDKPGEIGSPHSKIEGISGTWKLSDAQQIDGKSPIAESRDRTAFYTQGEETLQLTFNKSDMTYSVEIPSGINFFGSEGTWNLDDEFVATQLKLSSDGEETEFTLGNVVRYFDNELKLTYAKQCAADDKPYVLYSFTFTRQ